jgi:hypothetical protein
MDRFGSFRNSYVNSRPNISNLSHRPHPRVLFLAKEQQKQTIFSSSSSSTIDGKILVEQSRS